jgi:transcription antitermination factor NusG
MATLNACTTALLSEVNHVEMDGLEPRWYVAYTRPRHEKRIAEQLTERSLEQFLPLYETVHRWKDRKVKLQLPLFPGYIFVRIPLLERLKVLQVPGVVRLVGFGESPTALPEDEMEALRRGLKTGVQAQPHPYLTVGRGVRIVQGPFAGFKGILSRRKGPCRVVISLLLIKSSIALEVDAWDIGPS